jgi:hypothetical protein
MLLAFFGADHRDDSMGLTDDLLTVPLAPQRLGWLVLLAAWPALPSTGSTTRRHATRTGTTGSG